MRILKYEQLDIAKPYIEAAGLAEETKPTNCVTGSKFKEVDTGVEFLFDEVTGTWLSQASGRTSIVGATVTLGSAVSYDGTEKTKAVSSVVLGTSTLTANTDYIVLHNKATEPGNYVLQVVGIGSYCGVISKDWTLAKGTGAVVAEPDSLSLSDTAGESALTITGDGNVYIASSNEEVATAEIIGTNAVVTPVGVGEATVTITLEGNDHYTGATDEIAVTVSAADNDT